MSWLRRFFAFWYDFIVGDDWRLAVGVVAGLSLAGVLAHTGRPAAWLVLPAIVVVSLVISLRSATRRTS